MIIDFQQPTLASENPIQVPEVAFVGKPKQPRQIKETPLIGATESNVKAIEGSVGTSY
jgi:hypothetical protein